MSDIKYCKDCKNINCPENRVNCKYPDAIACGLYRDTPPTLFHRITPSPEVLAEKLVYCLKTSEFKVIDSAGRLIARDHEVWASTILPGSFWTKYEEAIAATVAKLKEVAE